MTELGSHKDESVLTSHGCTLMPCPLRRCCPVLPLTVSCSDDDHWNYLLELELKSSHSNNARSAGAASDNVCDIVPFGEEEEEGTKKEPTPVIPSQRVQISPPVAFTGFTSNRYPGD
jgi:hypothetical protein